MPPTSLLGERLTRQHLIAPALTDPAAVVRWQGAVQAQDFPGALWALALRSSSPVREADVLAPFDAGTVIRTHVLRPTWHLVPAEDVRWMLALTAPRLQAASGARYAALGLDAKTRSRAAQTIARALEGGRHLSRHELGAALRRVRINTDEQRLIHLLYHAELEGLICSGPRIDKQLTYALLDERVDRTPALTREESLARLMQRYFTSHGPATLQDASWWAGLSVGDVRQGVALAGESLERRVIDDREYWCGADARPPNAVRPAAGRRAPVVHLLPSFDEYTVAYRDRRALLHASTEPSSSTQSALLLQPVMLDGRHAGTWRRTLPSKASAPIRADVQLLGKVTGPQSKALQAAATRYGAFLGREVSLQVNYT